MLCSVLTASRSKALAQGLTYESGDLPIEPGMLVSVPLIGKIVEGVVLETNITRPQEEFKMRNITRIESDVPVLSTAQLATMRWMADYYRCDLRRAASVFLPPLPWFSLLPRRQFVLQKLKDDAGSAKQKLILDALAAGAKPEKQIKEETGVSDAVIRTMVKNGLVSRESERPKTEKTEPYGLEGTLPTLNAEQDTVLSEIRASKKPTLLFGVTGSGKTAVYAHLIAEEANKGRQSILLVPEILLSEELLHRFVDLFGRDRIVVLHSRLTLSERREVWRKISSGEAPLIIGSRSALFAPCRNLGLIVIDEEHEWTYKNEQTPRYHAREAAEKLCAEAGARLVLGSATPSLDSWKRAKDGRYTLCRLPERYGKQALPSVRVVDLGTVKFGQHYPFSPPLVEAINERLKKGEQTILFLNRRGMATSVLCLECRRRLVSKESGLPFTLHKTTAGSPILVDHASGGMEALPEKCPDCGSTRLLPVGAGTQRIEQIVSQLFPKARLLRADRDTLQSPDAIRSLLEKMHKREADILLGTQSVVKGLDLHGVTLAVVLLADVGLSLPHYRAGERVFQLLTQLTGRSGRASDGEVIIQTFSPDAMEVKLASSHATQEYLDEELKLRKQLGYPPESSLVRLVFEGTDAQTRATKIAAEANSEQGVSAHAAPTFFGGGKIWHVLIRSGRDLHPVLDRLSLKDVTVDIDPVDCL